MSVVAVGGALTVCVSAPPSDHELNPYIVSPIAAVDCAWTLAAWPTSIGCGPTEPVPDTPSSVTGRPAGLDLTVIVVDFGYSSIVFESVSPPESVTVTVIRRNEPASWSGATNVVVLTPVGSSRSCSWQSSALWQCWSPTCQVKRESASAPSWASVAWAGG